MEASKTGILLVNLGTPDSPATADVRKYLVEFLTDERVIDIPALQRNLLVRGIIGPFRAPKSAKSYREIWTKEGFPLMTISVALREKVAEALGDNYQVELAMRYQSQSIASALERLKGKFLKKLRIIPLFRSMHPPRQAPCTKRSCACFLHGKPSQMSNSSTAIRQIRG